MKSGFKVVEGSLKDEKNELPKLPIAKSGKPKVKKKPFQSSSAVRDTLKSKLSSMFAKKSASKY